MSAHVVGLPASDGSDGQRGSSTAAIVEAVGRSVVTAAVSRGIMYPEEIFILTEKPHEAFLPNYQNIY